MIKIKIQRYTIKAKHERTVVRVPVFGTKTSLRDLLKVVKLEDIPKDAAVNIVTTPTGRSVKFEFPA